MFALVNKEDNSIIRMYNGNKGITIGENQYPKYKPRRKKFECVDKPTKKKKKW